MKVRITHTIYDNWYELDDEYEVDGETNNGESWHPVGEDQDVWIDKADCIIIDEVFEERITHETALMLAGGSYRRMIIRFAKVLRLAKQLKSLQHVIIKKEEVEAGAEQMTLNDRDKRWFMIGCEWVQSRQIEQINKAHDEMLASQEQPR